MGIAQELETALTNVFEKFGFAPKPHTTPDSDIENLEYWHGDSQASIPDEPMPIPVVLLDDKAKFQRVLVEAAMSWTSQHFLLIAGLPQQLSGYNALKTSVTIVNKGAVNVAIDSFNNVKAAGLGNPNGSGELAPGDSITIATKSEVWAISATGTAADVMVYQTFQMGQGGQ